MPIPPRLVVTTTYKELDTHGFRQAQIAVVRITMPDGRTAAVGFSVSLNAAGSPCFGVEDFHKDTSHILSRELRLRRN